MKKVGIIAGSGKLPFYFIKEANEEGFEVIAIGIIGETDESLSKCCKCFWVKLGELGKIIKIFKKEGIKEIAMIGKVTHKKMFSNLSFDLKALKLLPKMKDKKTDSILSIVADEFEKEGFFVMDSRRFLKSCLAEKGILTKRKPTKEELEDIEFGRSIAKVLAGLDIGQTVVVKNKAILAVEAMEGTDETILRGGKIGKDVVVVKVSKPNQDVRFDIPTVGKDTISVLIAANAKVLALDAEKCFIIDKEEFIQEANKAHISVVVD